MKRRLLSWFIALSIVLTTVTLMVVVRMAGGFQIGTASLRAAPLIQAEPIQPATEPVSEPPPAKTQADPAWTRWDALTVDVQAKVDPRILAELRGLVVPAYLGGDASLVELQPDAGQARSATRFLVYLYQQPNANTLLANLVVASQAEGRDALFSALASESATAQAGVRSALDGQLAASNVTSYQPFYIVNALAVEGNLTTIIELAQRADVARLVANYPLQTSQEATTGSVPAEAPVQAAGPQVTQDNWNIALVEADRAWSELGVNGQGAVVAGFDTGVSYRHPALINQYRGNLHNGSFDHNYNWFAPDGNLYPNGNLGPSTSQQPVDCSGHGTHTMGTAVGNGPPGRQVGMAPGASWIAIPGICYDTMPGGINDDIGALKAFQWLLCPTDLTGDLSTADCSKAPDVVNNSWGSANPINDVLRPALQMLRAAGIAPVFAAGNPSAGAGSIGTPANAPEAITVGATDRVDKVASFSGRGPSFYVGEQKPELSAPGVSVLSSLGALSYREGSGTSMAAPHVTGLIALLVSADLQDGVRDLSVDEIERLMTDTALDLGKAGPDDDYGYGRINAYAAVKAALTAGDLRGTVRDASTHQPIAQASITARRAASNDGFHTYSDSSGVYSLTVPGGDYNLQVTAFGYTTATFSVQSVLPNALAMADFTLTALPTATLSGLVRSNGAPVAGAILMLQSRPTLSATTGADGGYALTLPLGDYDFLVKAIGQHVAQLAVSVQAGANRRDIELQSAPSILIVEADAWRGWFDGWSTLPLYRWALDQPGYTYDIWSIQYPGITGTKTLSDSQLGYGLPPLSKLVSYDVVIWSQAGCYSFYSYCYYGGTPRSLGANGLLQQYLDGGGRLILSGQDIGDQDDDNALYDNYLHADRSYDEAANESDQLLGSGFLAGLSLELTNASLYGFANGSMDLSPDGVKPPAQDGTAYSVLAYANGHDAAVLAVDPCSAPYRAVYMAMGYENIGPRAAQRDPAIASVLDRSIQWVTGQKPAVGLALTAYGLAVQTNAGKQAEFHLRVSNTGANPAVVNLTTSGNSWATTIVSGTQTLPQPLQLAPCTAQEFTVAVTVTANAPNGQQDQVTVRAALADNPGNVVPAQQVTLTTTAFMEWQAAAPMPTARYRLGTAALPNDIYIYTMGGWYSSYSSASPVAQRYNTCTDQWENLPYLPEGRANVAAVALNGLIYVVGGNDSGYYGGLTVYDRVWAYNPQTKVWTAVAPLPEGHMGMAAAAVNGKLYAFGGRNTSLAQDDVTYIYDPASNSWSNGAPMPGGGRSYASATTLNNKIYVVGGWPNLRTVEVYEPQSDQWSSVAGLQTGRQSPALSTGPDGHLYAAGGGYFWSGLNSVERYNPTNNQWLTISPLQDNGHVAAGGAYAAGQLFVLGGTDAMISAEALKLTSAFCLSSKQVSANAATLGSRLIYTITVQADPFDNPRVQVTDQLPTHTLFAGFVHNAIGASYNDAQRRIEWGGFLPANTPPIQLVYALDVIPTGWKDGAAIVNSVVFSNATGLTIERTAMSVLQLADFSPSTLNTDRPLAVRGEEITYTLHLRGRTFAGGALTVRDPLPAAVTYVADSLTYALGAGGYDAATHTINWAGVVPAALGAFVNTSKNFIWGDSDRQGDLPGVNFQWIDIRQSGTPVTGGDEEHICNLPMGFPFPYFGLKQESFCVNTNGFVAFDPSIFFAYYNECPLPSSSSHDSIIAALWDDLVIEDSITYQSFGIAPNRYLVVQWNGARRYATSSGELADFQLILYESGLIRVQILKPGALKNHLFTIGLEDYNGSLGVTYTCNRPGVVHDNLAILFAPPGVGTGEAQSTLSFRVRGLPSLGVNSLLTNTAIISAPTAIFTRSATLLMNPVELGNSTITMDQREVVPQGELRYTVVLRNSGQLTATNASLGAQLSTATTLVAGSLSCSSGQCNAVANSAGGSVANNVAWTGAVAAGRPVTVSFAVKLTTVLPDRTPVTATLQLSDGFGNFYGLPVSFMARRSDVRASRLVFQPEAAEPGDTVNLALSLQNRGIMSTTAEAQASIPAGLVAVADSLVCGTGVCTLTNGVIHWSGVVAARAVIPVRLSVRIPVSATYGTHFISNAQVKDRQFGDEQLLQAEVWVARNSYLPMIAVARQASIYLPLLINSPSSPFAVTVVIPAVLVEPGQ